MDECEVCEVCGDDSPVLDEEGCCSDECRRHWEDGGDDSFGPGYFDDEQFANPGGTSALRAAGPDNPRNLPCPNCGGANRLTPADKARGYQCDPCADRAERGCDY